ncbi:hypothetical protein [Estrella lausannensis]|nr:hypothetical protein [Estrella lausannensis]
MQQPPIYDGDKDGGALTLENILTTVALAFVIVSIALALIGIGYLVTGKNKIRLGSCGRNPHQDKDGSCGTKRSCSLCDKDEKEQK